MEPVDCFCGLTPKKANRQKPKSTSSGSTPRSPPPPIAQPPPAPRRKRQDELMDVFSRFDVDNDGKISAEELRSYFASIGDHMSREDAQAIIDHFDQDNDRLLCMKDFKRLMEDEESKLEREEDMKAAFGVFEVERGSGRITAKSLQRALRQLGDPKSYEDCVAMIRGLDSQGKGELGYGEFHQMMAA